MESCYNKSHHGLLFVVLVCSFVGVSVQSRLLQSTPMPTKRHFHFNIEWKTMTRLCSSKPLLTVNGEFPGPTIDVHEGDEVEITVTNTVEYNTTIHWHGIKQFRTGWADGPAYITQCPIQSNRSYTYRFRVVDQRGTYWWHAHLSWQRASIHGAFIVRPRSPYPFPTPVAAEIPVVLGEWWKVDTQAVEDEAMAYGGGPNVSDAYTINGLPGPLYSCSDQDTFVQSVEQGKSYMLRIISAILIDEVFFGVAGHSLTVVEIDGTYVKPFKTPAIMITPGQTMNVLVKASHSPLPHHAKSFAMAARPYLTADFPFDGTTTVGFIKYEKPNNYGQNQLISSGFYYPRGNNHPQNISLHFLPPMEDTAFNTKFSTRLRSLASTGYPCNVPKQVDKHVFLTISLNLQDCPPNIKCRGYLGKRFTASINNQSFVRPPISILESHYRNVSSQPLSLDFPEKPPYTFNYTRNISLHANMNPEYGSKILSFPYGTRLQFVLQDTSFIHTQNHPIHFHGHNFFIVGSGFGNFDAKRDPAGFNLEDPPERNTVAVPAGGWAAIRFTADNPGAWFIHCHIEAHTSWGLATAFIVEDGPTPLCLLPPPEDLPLC